jgi:8-hydroxy-5-deazaflavin:NADPH oxidoreductase
VKRHVHEEMPRPRLAGDGTPAGTPGRRALPIAGDDGDAKRVVAGLIDEWGFDVVDAGRLAEG